MFSECSAAFITPIKYLDIYGDSQATNFINIALTSGIQYVKKSLK